MCVRLQSSVVYTRRAAHGSRVDPDRLHRVDEGIGDNSCAGGELSSHPLRHGRCLCDGHPAFLEVGFDEGPIGEETQLDGRLGGEEGQGVRRAAAGDGHVCRARREVDLAREGVGEGVGGAELHAELSARRRKLESDEELRLASDASAERQIERAVHRDARARVDGAAPERLELVDRVLLQRARRGIESDLARQRLRRRRRHRRPAPIDTALPAGEGWVLVVFGRIEVALVDAPLREEVSPSRRRGEVAERLGRPSRIAAELPPVAAARRLVHCVGHPSARSGGVGGLRARRGRRQRVHRRALASAEVGALANGVPLAREQVSIRRCAIHHRIVRAQPPFSGRRFPRRRGIALRIFHDGVVAGLCPVCE
mmetsp:Transcript_32536/g.75896  ORF Transcript_32536/g.75896 Transcript_32536/m.75896 type:complete len:369 (-) Transcript_32536:632-1738(-)